MKIKKCGKIALIGISLLCFLTLAIILLTGCSTNLEKKSKNLSSYNIDIEFFDKEKTLSCTEKVTYINSTETSLNYICFHLYPNAFRENSNQSVVNLSSETKAYPNGKSYGNISIEKVCILENVLTENNPFNSNNPTYSEISQYSSNDNLFFVGGEDENILFVIFNNAIFPDETIEIEISFKVVLPNINHRFGYGNNTINLANFYPIACVFTNGDYDKSPYNSNGDPFFSEMSNYHVNLTCPTDYVVSNTGEVKTQKTYEKTKTLSIEASVVRDFALVISKEFKTLSKQIENTEVKYYYFSDKTPEKSLETAVDALVYFSSLIGKYPYSTLSVVEANFVHGGMEFPNLVYISNEITDPVYYRQVIVHEIAHQWWYNMVGNSAFSYGWLDEGLTEYSTAMFFETYQNYEISKEVLISNAYSTYALFVEVYEKVYGSIDTSMNRNLNEFESDQQYVYVAYVKGMLLFDSLREIIGKEKFEKCLKNYFEEYKFQNVTPSCLISSFEKTTKTNLENYFSSWINGEVVLLK